MGHVNLMVVMPSNNSGSECESLFLAYPGRLGHLQSADSTREPKWGQIWALDNGVFGAYSAGREWNEVGLYAFLEKHSSRRPRWVAVPDWVGDKSRTLAMWDEHAERVEEFGVPLAFVVQDGMTPRDVPANAHTVFVGGSTPWKWRNLKTWTSEFPHVHVGRVNTHRLLWMAHMAGAESCDGTGWFRGCQQQLRGLWRYLEESHGGGVLQGELRL